MRVRFLGLTCLLFGSVLSAQVKLVVGELNLPVSGHSSAFCAQIPIFLLDESMDQRAYTYMNFTVALSGDTSIINGNVSTAMLVAGGFTPLVGGIRSPGLDLNNPGNNPSTPTCSIILNQATEGYPSYEFATALLPSTAWFLNNNLNGQGYKTGFVLDFGLNPIGNSVQNTLQLIAVLEIPIVANPGQSTLSITAIPNTTIPDANVVEWLDGGVYTSAALDLSRASGALRFCPQTLSTQPADVNACPGEDASFSVVASGTGPFTYQWYHGETLLVDATASTLTLSNLSSGDLGSYSCQITSPCASVRSASGTLSLGDLALSISPLGNALGLNPITLTGLTTCASPSATYQWFDSQNTLLGEDASLLISPLPSADETYTLFVNDGVDRTVSASATILVNTLSLDNNGDGQNTIEDLRIVLPLWQIDGYDVNNDGRTNVRDFLYINTGL